MLPITAVRDVFRANCRFRIKRKERELRAMFEVYTKRKKIYYTPRIGFCSLQL